MGEGDILRNSLRTHVFLRQTGLSCRFEGNLQLCQWRVFLAQNRARHPPRCSGPLPERGSPSRPRHDLQVPPREPRGVSRELVTSMISVSLLAGPFADSSASSNARALITFLALTRLLDGVRSVRLLRLSADSWMRYIFCIPYKIPNPKKYKL